MKIKDLLCFNPEAEIVFEDCNGNNLKIEDISWLINDGVIRVSEKSKSNTSKVYVKINDFSNLINHFINDNNLQKKTITGEEIVKLYNVDNCHLTAKLEAYENLKTTLTSAINSDSPTKFNFNISEHQSVIPQYDNDVLFLTSNFKIIKLSPYNDILKTKLNSQEGDVIHISFALEHKPEKAHTISIANLTNGLIHENMSLNVLARALKTYKLERLDK